MSWEGQEIPSLNVLSLTQEASSLDECTCETLSRIDHFIRLQKLRFREQNCVLTILGTGPQKVDYVQVMADLNQHLQLSKECFAVGKTCIGWKESETNQLILTGKLCIMGCSFFIQLSNVVPWVWPWACQMEIVESPDPWVDKFALQVRWCQSCNRANRK